MTTEQALLILQDNPEDLNLSDLATYLEAVQLSTEALKEQQARQSEVGKWN